MKKEKNYFLNKQCCKGTGHRAQGGITLIALVVTIIILLILAGLALSLVMGSNGIIGKAEKAVGATQEAMIKEDIQLTIVEKMAEYYEDYENLVGEFPTVMDYVKAQFEDGSTTNAGATLKYNEEKDKFEYTQNGQMIEVNIDENGNVTLGKTIDAPEEPEKPVAKYKVTYNANGGSGAPTDTTEYEKGATVTVDFSTIPTKTGYTFLGWAENKDAETADYSERGTKTFEMGEKNVTLYAVWEKRELVSSANVGEYVDLGTNLLDRDILLSDRTKPTTDWRVFYTEGDNVWLIMSDYLPYSANSTVGTTLTNTGPGFPYGWKSDISRKDLIEQLNDTSKWKNLLPTNLKNNTNVTAAGALDVETWVAAWNANGGEHLVTTYVTSGYNAEGYLISKKDSGDATDDIVVGLDNGKTLFFPQNGVWSNTEAYWLASPTTRDPNWVMHVYCEGYVSYGNAYNCGYGYGVRPVVRMPASLLDKGSDGIWSVAE